MASSQGWPCRACGDLITDDTIRNRARRLEKVGKTLDPQDPYYCGECADELFRNHISIRPAQLYSSGSGREREPSPWQENAVRHLEDSR